MGETSTSTASRLFTSSVFKTSFIAYDLLPSGCDLRNQEGADKFRAEVEELGRKRESKSKVAQAAEEDNLSGKGIMDDGAAAGGTTA